MQRKRGELVPIGEALADLGGPVQAIRKTPPPARRGFTRFDQVNQLVSASEADPNRGFMARMMVLCSLPRINTHCDGIARVIVPIIRTLYRGPAFAAD